MPYFPAPSSGSGAPGKSAYQIATDNGFAGSEADWLASLVGGKGDPGNNGAIAYVFTTGNEPDASDGVQVGELGIIL